VVAGLREEEMVVAVDVLAAGLTVSVYELEAPGAYVESPV